MGFNSLPAWRIIETGQLHPLMGARRQPALSYYRACFLWPLVVHSAPTCDLCVTSVVCDVVLPTWIYVWTAVNLIHPMPGITYSAIPTTLGWESSLISGVKRKIKTLRETSNITIRNLFLNFWWVLLLFQTRLWISTPISPNFSLSPAFGGPLKCAQWRPGVPQSCCFFKFSCPFSSLWRVSTVTRWSSLDNEISGFSIGLFWHPGGGWGLTPCYNLVPMEV